MRNAFRTMVSALILVLMFAIFGVSVFAASETLTSYRYAQFRGNGTYSGEGIKEEVIEIGADKTTDYYIFARTSGASVAFYSDFTFVVRYTATPNGRIGIGTT